VFYESFIVFPLISAYRYRTGFRFGKKRGLGGRAPGRGGVATGHDCRGRRHRTIITSRLIIRPPSSALRRNNSAAYHTHNHTQSYTQSHTIIHTIIHNHTDINNNPHTIISNIGQTLIISKHANFYSSSSLY
jgi:hypothetical protein